MRTKNILASVAVLSTVLSSGVFAADLENIEVLNNGTLSVSTTSDLIVPNGEVNGDLKVLKDHVVTFAYKDPQNAKRVVINLTYELEKNKNYNIIGIDGADANMNFQSTKDVVGEYINPAEKTSGLNIEKIVVTDPKTLEIYYDKELKSEEFIYRILSEVVTKAKIGNGENSINIILSSPLEALTSYIILSNSVQDKEGKDVKLDEAFYEFTTGDNLENVFEELPEEEELVVTEELPEDNGTGNLEEVALNSARTPDTGAATWILILATLLATGIIVVSTKKA